MTFRRLLSMPPGHASGPNEADGSAAPATFSRRPTAGRPIGLWIWLVSGLAIALFVSTLPLSWGTAHGQWATGTGVGPPGSLTGPRGVRISNVGPTGFTVSWTTTDPIVGYACFWKVADGPQTAQLAYDMSGLTPSRVHYVNVGPADDGSPSPVEPGVLYAGDVRSANPGDSLSCTNSQERGRVQTAVYDGLPPVPFTARGSVVQPGEAPVDAVVYLRVTNVGGQSSLLSARVRSVDGSWAIPLANARIDTSPSANTVTVDGYWPLAATERVAVEAWASPEVMDRSGSEPIGSVSPAVVAPLQLGARRIELNQGFNLISFNVVPPSTAIGDVLAPISNTVVGVNSFESLSGGDGPPGARSYYPDLVALSDLRQMDRLHGYWVNVLTATVLYVGGPIATNTDITLGPGWNLVSYLPNEPMPVTDALASVLSDVVRVEGTGFSDVYYDRGSPSTVPLRPGRAYWIKLRDDLAGTRTLTYLPGAP